MPEIQSYTEMRKNLDMFVAWVRDYRPDAYKEYENFFRNVEPWDHDVYAKWIMDYFETYKTIRKSDGSEGRPVDLYELDDKFMYINNPDQMALIPKMDIKGLTILVDPSIQLEKPDVDAAESGIYWIYWDTMGRPQASNSDEIYVYEILKDVLMKDPNRIMTAMMSGASIPFILPEELPEQNRMELSEDGVFSLDSIIKADNTPSLLDPREDD